jgi:hypothetical protein
VPERADARDSGADQGQDRYSAGDGVDSAKSRVTSVRVVHEISSSGGFEKSLWERHEGIMRTR